MKKLISSNSQNQPTEKLKQVETTEKPDWRQQMRDFNQKAKEEGRLAEGMEPGVTQIIFFRKNPVYPNKDVNNTIKLETTNLPQADQAGSNKSEDSNEV